MARGRGQAKRHQNDQPNNNTGCPPSTGLSNQNPRDRGATNQGQSTAKSSDACKGGFTNKCGRPVTEDNEALQCDSCNRWFHISCQGVPKQRYDDIIALHDDDMPWYCHECRLLVPKLLNSLGVITKRCDAMMDEIHHLKLRVTIIENKDVDDDEARQDMIKEKCRELFQTEAERVKMRNNIIIFGLAESENPKSEIRMQYDSAKVNDILSDQIGLSHVSFDKVIRLTPHVSKPANINKPRPTKVILPSVDYRGDILRKAKTLKSPRNPQYKVVIAPDMCKVDKEENDRLIEELWKKRNDSRNKNENCSWVIRHKKIVRILESGNA
ncbi:hypothetical protein SK128_019605, partial [Halocaridina rubra]